MQVSLFHSDLLKIKYSVGKTRFLIDNLLSSPGLSSNGISEDFSVSGPRSFYGMTKFASELLIQVRIQLRYKIYYKSMWTNCGSRSNGPKRSRNNLILDCNALAIQIFIIHWLQWFRQTGS